jgi:hypothetical protein
LGPKLTGLVAIPVVNLPRVILTEDYDGVSLDICLKLPEGLPSREVVVSVAPTGDDEEEDDARVEAEIQVDLDKGKLKFPMSAKIVEALQARLVGFEDNGSEKDEENE